MSATQEQLQHLAQWVRRRRVDELDYTQLEVQALDGPSNTTLTKVENAVDEPSRSTLKKLDAGLMWKPGSARRVLYDMGEPEPEGVSGGTLRRAIEASGEVDEETRARLLSVLDDRGPSARAG